MRGYRTLVRSWPLTRPAFSRPTSPQRGEVHRACGSCSPSPIPAVFVNLGHGHNGFLTAALMAFALINLDTRPILAGVLFGLLAYKPQFGLMIPLVLLATGRWRTLFAAGATVVLLVIAATLAFGFETWRAFFRFAEYTRAIVLETGETGWHKIQSVFSWARMWGATCRSPMRSRAP